jgi:hypothetical protein
MPVAADRAQVVAISLGKQHEVAGSKVAEPFTIDPYFALTLDDDMDTPEAGFGKRDPERRTQPE